MRNFQIHLNLVSTARIVKSEEAFAYLEINVGCYVSSMQGRPLPDGRVCGCGHEKLLEAGLDPLDDRISRVMDGRLENYERP